MWSLSVCSFCWAQRGGQSSSTSSNSIDDIKAKQLERSKKRARHRQERDEREREGKSGKTVFISSAPLAPLPSSGRNRKAFKRLYTTHHSMTSVRLHFQSLIIPFFSFCFSFLFPQRKGKAIAINWYWKWLVKPLRVIIKIGDEYKRGAKNYPLSSMAWMWLNFPVIRCEKGSYGTNFFICENLKSLV